MPLHEILFVKTNQGGDYPHAGHIIAAKPPGHPWGPGETDDPRFAITTIDITEEQRLTIPLRHWRVKAPGNPEALAEVPEEHRVQDPAAV